MALHTGHALYPGQGARDTHGCLDQIWVSARCLIRVVSAPGAPIWAGEVCMVVLLGVWGVHMCRVTRHIRCRDRP
jgi:hypothetical protein